MSLCDQKKINNTEKFIKIANSLINARNTCICGYIYMLHNPRYALNPGETVPQNPIYAYTILD